MKPISKILLILVAAGAGLGLGVALRNKQSARLASAEASAAASNRHSPSSARHPAARDDSPLTTQLEKNLALSTGVTRWLYWLAAIEKAAPSDFPRLAQLAKKNPAALRLVAARWAAIAPRQMFDYLARFSREEFGDQSWDLKSSLLREWLKSDREAVIAALNERPPVLMQESWRHEVADAVMGTDPERGLSLFAEWSIYNYGPRLNGVVKWAAQDPAHAAQYALDHPAGYASQGIMEAIGKEWGKTDPAAALAFASKKPGDLANRLANAAMAQWTGQDLDAAGAWLAAADAGTRARLTPALVEVWAKQDAGSAIAWCQENLSDNNLSQAVAGVLKGAADKDAAAAAALVSDMDPSPERAAGAAQVAKKWFPATLGGTTLKPENVQWLASLDGDSINRALDEVRWQWSSVDPKSMADFLTANGNKSTEEWTYSVVARELVRKDPLDAMAWASQQGPDRALKVGGDAFAEWSVSQSDAAMKWLNDLPANDARRQPFLQSAIRALAWDRNSTAQFAALSTTDPATARDVVNGMNLPSDRRTQLLEAIKQQ